MSITISISEKTEAKIRSRAAKTGKDVATVVGDLIEEVWDEHSPKDETTDEMHSENPLKPFIGMFSSGKTDTSGRYKDILLEDIKMPGGFGGT